MILAILFNYKRVVLTSQFCRITDKNIEILDQAAFQDIDLIIRPREWNDDDGNVKIKAYLQTMFVVLYEDELVKKFNSLSAE